MNEVEARDSFIRPRGGRHMYSQSTLIDNLTSEMQVKVTYIFE